MLCFSNVELHTLLNQTSVSLPVCSKVNQLTHGHGEGMWSVYANTKQGEWASYAEKPKLPNTFQRRGFTEWGNCKLCDQLAYNSQIGWRQGDVSSIINLVSVGLGSVWLWLAVSIWCGSASCKNNLGMCVKPLSTSSGNWVFCDSDAWQNYTLTCSQFPVILCLYIFTFPNH